MSDMSTEKILDFLLFFLSYMCTCEDVLVVFCSSDEHEQFVVQKKKCAVCEHDASKVTKYLFQIISGQNAGTVDARTCPMSVGTIEQQEVMLLPSVYR